MVWGYFPHFKLWVECVYLPRSKDGRELLLPRSRWFKGVKSPTLTSLLPVTEFKTPTTTEFSLYPQFLELLCLDV